MSEDQMLRLMAEEPRLIRRPLIMTPEGTLFVGADRDAMADFVSG